MMWNHRKIAKMELEMEIEISSPAVSFRFWDTTFIRGKFIAHMCGVDEIANSLG